MIRRFTRPVLFVIVLGFGIHVLLPQVGEFQQSFEALRTGRWPFLGLAAVGSVLTFFAGAWTVRASVDRRLPPARTTIVQLAASAAAVLTPMGVGWVVVNQSYLRRQGVDEATARAATGLTMILTVASHIGLLLLAIPFLPALQLPTIPPPERRIFVDVAVAAAIVVGIVFWVPRTRTRVLAVIRPTLQAVPRVLADPRRSLHLAVGAVSANLAYAIALYAAIAAFGPASPPLGVLVAYLLAATIAAIAPTPGGLGAMETALVSTLTRLAVPGGQAVAATLTFRLITFWLPLAAGGLAIRSARKRELI